MENITVFCGSSSGNEDVFKETAFHLGQCLAERNIGLIYGGARVGLMGAVADGAISKKGRVTGILPRFLSAKELAHDNLSELIIVDTMHERKYKMNELCDGVIALPGGFGTLEELFEMLTWGQLGLHRKPIGILNIDGFYDPLLTFIQTMVDKHFLKEVNRQMILVDTNIEGLLDKMGHYTPSNQPKWIVNP